MHMHMHIHTYVHARSRVRTQVIAQQLVSLEVGIVEGLPAEEYPGAGRRGEATQGGRDGRAQPGGLRALESTQERPVAAVPGVREHHHPRLKTAVRSPRGIHAALVFLLLLVDVREVDPRVR